MESAICTAQAILPEENFHFMHQFARKLSFHEVFKLQLMGYSMR